MLDDNSDGVSVVSSAVRLPSTRTVADYLGNDILIATALVMLVPVVLYNLSKFRERCKCR